MASWTSPLDFYIRSSEFMILTWRLQESEQVSAEFEWYQCWFTSAFVSTLSCTYSIQISCEIYKIKQRGDCWVSELTVDHHASHSHVSHVRPFSDFLCYKLTEDPGNKRTEKGGERDLILDLCPPRWVRTSSASNKSSPLTASVLTYTLEANYHVPSFLFQNIIINLV